MALEKIKPFIVDGTQDFVFGNATVTGNITSNNANLGNLATANFFSGTLTTGNQPNITSVGTLGNLSVTSNISAGNIKTNNLLYANGSPWSMGGDGATVSGSNSQVQFNDASSFGASANFTFDKTSNTLTVTNLVTNGSGITNITGSSVTGQVPNALISATVYNNSQPNITSVGTLSSLTVTGSIASGNADLGNTATANYFIGSGNNLSNIQGSNITGAVAYATTANSVTGSNVSGAVTYAATANAVAGANVLGQVGNSLVSGTVYTNSQPNITSVGTLTSLIVTGNVTGGNLVTAGKVYSSDFINGGTGIYLSAGPSGYINFFTTDGDKASISDTGNITASNIVANSTIFATTANISGNLSSGNANLGNAAVANFFVGSGAFLTSVTAVTAATVTATSQPNITGVGTLTSITVSGNSDLGNAGNVKITGGTTGQYLQTDGSGNLTWSTVISGGASNISNGTSNINIPSANGNINLTSNGNTTLVVTGTGANISGYANITGNITAPYFIGNGSQLTGVDKLLVGNADQANYISNGTSNINTPILNGNIAVGIAGTSNTVIFTSTGVNVAGYVNATSNITAPYFIGNGAFLTGVDTSPANISNGNSNVNISAGGGNVTTSVNGTANVLVVAKTGANINGYANVTGNITAAYYFGNGSLLTGVGSLANGTSNIFIVAAGGNVTTSVNGVSNVLVVTGSGANVKGYVTANGNVSGGNVSASGQLVSTLADGTPPLLVISTTQVPNLNVATAGVVTTNSQPNITSLGTLTGLTSNGNVNFTDTSNVTLGSVGNLHVSGGANGQVLSTDGNSNLYWSDVATGGGGSNILNGTSNVSIDGSGGNINASVNGNSNIFVITGTGVNVAGYTSITGIANISGNLNLTGARSNLGPLSNLTIPGGVSGYVLTTNGSGNLSWNAQATGGSGTAAIQEFVASAGQDTFEILGGYNVGSVLVFVNGIQMNNNDYIATDTIYVVLAEPRNTGDIVRVISSMVSPAINVNNIKSFSVAMSIALGV
jgi:hypothetical protein